MADHHPDKTAPDDAPWTHMPVPAAPPQRGTWHRLGRAVIVALMCLMVFIIWAFSFVLF